MAITVTDNRTEIDQADSNTGWTGSDGAPTLFTTNPSPKENSGHLGYQVSNETHYLYHVATAENMSAGVLFYVWVLPQGIMETRTNYGYSPLIGDGTNRVKYQLGGSDAALFRHDSGSSVNHQCLVIDTGNLPTGAAETGTVGSLDLSSITDFGASFTTLVKSVGGVENCFVDVMFVGNGGLTITGTDTAAYWMDDLSVLDAAGTSGASSYGICRKLGEGVYGFQGPIFLGDTGTGTDVLRIIDQTFSFEDRNFATNKYGLTLQGNSSGSQTFTFTDSIFSVPSGVGAYFDASDGNVDTVSITGCLFSNWDQRFLFADAGANAGSWTVENNTFNGCATIELGLVNFDNNRVTNSAATVNAVTIENDVTALNLVVSGYEGNTSTGALLWNDNTNPGGNIDGAEFTIGDASTHAIQFGTNTPTSISLTDITFNGYNANNEQANSTLLFPDTGADVTWTVNVSGGTGNVSYTRSRVGDTVNIIQDPVTTEVVVRNGAVTPATLLQDARVILEAADNTGDLPYRESVSITRSGSTATVTHTGHGLSTNNYVAIRGANQPEYNGAKQITVTGANTYTYTVSGTPVTPATGTINSTGVVIFGLTDSNGSITDSRTWSNPQPVIGKVRKSTSPPLFKSQSIQGTISTTNGLTLTALMQLDE